MSTPAEVTERAFPVYDKGRSFRWRGRITGLVLAIFGIAALLSQPWTVAHPWIGQAFGIGGWLLFLCGAGMRFWATLYLGGRKGQTVVTEGPYSICRNPLYVGSFCLWLSAGLFLGSVFFFVGVAVVTCAYVMATVPAEERFLLSRFGDTYKAYCERVPRIIPKPSLYHSASPIEVAVSSIKAECRRASRWIWIPVIANLIGFMRTQPWWPHLFPLI